MLIGSGKGEAERMRTLTIDDFAGPIAAPTPAAALGAWFSLIRDLDELQAGYLNERVCEDRGATPVHDALAALSRTILSYGPSSREEALATLAILNHDEAGGIALCAGQLAKRARAHALLDTLSSSKEA